MEQEKPYNIMSAYYDRLLEHVEYDKWYNYIKMIMNLYVENPDKILEVGTGTGKFGAKFSKDGYEIYGVDSSLAMCQIASKRARNNFRILCADARDLHLNEKFNFVFMIHDTLNYITEITDLKKVFENIYNIMDEKSIFFFDITTEYNVLKHFHMQRTNYKINGDEICWDNKYHKARREIHSKLIFKTKDDKVYTEKHIQRIHSVNEIKKIISSSGLKLLDIYSDYSFETYNEKTIMINFITRKG